MKRIFILTLTVLLSVCLLQPAAASAAINTGYKEKTAGSGNASGPDGAEYADEDFARSLTDAIAFRYGESPDSLEDLDPDDFNNEWEAEYEIMKKYDGASFEDEDLPELAASYLAGLKMICAACRTENNEELMKKGLVSGMTVYYAALEELAGRYGIDLDSGDMEAAEIMSEAFDILLEAIEEDIDGGDPDGTDTGTDSTGIYLPPEEVFPIVEEGGFTGELLDDGTVRITEYTLSFDECGAIPDTIKGHPVSEIGYEAFAYYTFTDLVIPETVKEIARSAFEYAEITDSITFPEGIRIDASAFEYADLPENVVIPKNANVGPSAFSYCTGLKSLVLEDGVTLEKRAFEYAEDLETIVLSPGNTIGDSAFAYIDTLKELTANEDSVSTDDIYVDERAFYHSSISPDK